MSKKGLLVVSFGTSFKETREKTIGAIENRLGEVFADYDAYSAFTSKMIKRKLAIEGIFVFDVKEALEQMIKDGINKVLIQPTYIINGIEFDMMKEDINLYQGSFETIDYGNPLLTDKEDYKELASIINKEYPVDEDEMLVLMGHGSEHHANSAYPAFDYVLQDLSLKHILVGTVEGYPSFEEVKKKLRENNAKKVCLVPMMIVAGDHANNDMVGDDDSWKAQLEQEGYTVRYFLRGLGEIYDVQNMFVRHAKEKEN